MATRSSKRGSSNVLQLPPVDEQNETTASSSLEVDGDPQEQKNAATNGDKNGAGSNDASGGTGTTGGTDLHPLQQQVQSSFHQHLGSICTTSSGYDDYDSDLDTDSFDTSSEYSQDNSDDSSHRRRARERQSLTQGMASRENSLLCLSRGRVLVIMAICAFALCFIIRSFTIRSEYAQFHEEFEDFATIIVSSIQTNWQRGIGEMDSLAVSITTYSAATTTAANSGSETTSSSFPFQVIPDFDIRASSTRTLANAMFVSFIPLVSQSQRMEWETFALQNADLWIKDSLENDEYSFNYTAEQQAANDVEDELQESRARQLQRQLQRNVQQKKFHKRRWMEEVLSTDGSGNKTDQLLMESDLKDFWHSYGQANGIPINVTSTYGMSTTIYEMDGIHKIVARNVTDNNMDYHYPIWQSNPVSPELINFDFSSHSDFGNEIVHATTNQKALVGKIADIATLSDPFHALLDDDETYQNDGDESVITTMNDDDEGDNTTSENNQRAPKKKTRLSASTSIVPTEHAGPVGTIMFPVFNAFRPPKEIIGVALSMIRWSEYLRSAQTNLPDKAVGITCVVENECNQIFSFEISAGGQNMDVEGRVQGQDPVRYLGEGDLHDSNFDFDGVHVSLPLVIQDAASSGFSGAQVDVGYCPYSIHVYPSFETYSVFVTNKGTISGLVVLLFFAISIAAFSYFDSYVERRQKALIAKAEASNNIVTSLFPEVVRDRLFGNVAQPAVNMGNGPDAELVGAETRNPKVAITAIENEKLRLKNFLTSNQSSSVSQPIADLFTDCTVLFADIAGFTAWSSVREPVQVFTLLETLYAAFDKIATKRRVFKVETIGDCYMAVTGLPDPQPDHAILMARFARGCLFKTQILTRQLEVVLGPDTTDLAMRIGLHSGPVTAGVLRGQKSRFQLFGDTVNTASRMESTGRPECIQCSENTAELLKSYGKGSWLRPRPDLVKAKGKGEVQTFWITPKSSTGSVISSFETATTDTPSYVSDAGSIPNSLIRQSLHSLELAFPASRSSSIGPNRKRTIHWNVDLLSQIIKKIIANRSHSSSSLESEFDESGEEKEDEGLTMSDDTDDDNDSESTSNPRDEYSESIPMPKFDPSSANQSISPEDIVLDCAVESQLRDFVSTIALAYRDNPFHNFDHASHVAMSVNKILKRIIQADDFDRRRSLYSNIDDIASDLHNYTYGLTSDPLTHFACVFSAMIHDVDHPGVSNQQLVKEKDDMATMYDGKSVAEQNSFDFSWELFMDAAYEELRSCIFSTKSELMRFRKLVINSVMATDVFDPELVKLRNQRWEKAFADDAGDSEDARNARATIVIEHIIQASDVAHTMQHWHVYQKWNAKLFDEMHAAFQAGRLAKDPSESWYKGELWFYDNYIIPLAKKLKQCGVFGVASDEFLTYALDNRSEWEMKGEDIVKDLKAKVESKNDDESSISSTSTDDDDDEALQFCENLQQAYEDQLKQ